jgi:hypothetical protein
MIKAPQRLCLALVLGVVSSYTPASVQQQGRPKTIKIMLKVESQGPQGLWMQAGKDLSSVELNQLRSLIIAELGKLPNHKLVSSDDKEDAMGLSVVAEKLQCGRETYVLLSSALILAKADGTDLLVTHDAVAESSLALAAKAVVGHLTSAELRGMLGLR